MSKNKNKLFKRHFEAQRKKHIWMLKQILCRRFQMYEKVVSNTRDIDVGKGEGRHRVAVGNWEGWGYGGVEG